MSNDAFPGPRRGVAVLTALLAALLHGCDNRPAENPTRGRVTVAVCEEVLPLLRAEEAKFEELYPEASVELVPVSAREAIARLFADSVKVIVSSRALNAEERAAQAAAKLEVREIPVALDALAVIVNAANPVEQLSLPAADSVFSGALRDWALLGWRGAPAAIRPVIPDRNMASHEVFLERALPGRAWSPRAAVASSSPAMIDSVAADPAAIGIVGLNWVRNPHSRIRILALSDPAAPESLGIAGKHFAPHQAYVYKRYYPIVRTVYLYVTPDSYGVSSGFTSFITSAPGQKIVQDQGLVPATMPVRIVELRNENL